MSDSKKNTNKPRSFSGFDTIEEENIPNAVNISGMCKIIKNLECNALKISGSVNSQGNLNIHGNLENSGMFSVAGSVIVENEMHSSGSSKINGNLQVKGTIRSSGMFTCDGNLYIEHDVKTSGMMNAHGHLTASQSFDANGITRVDGNLIASNINFNGEAFLPFGFMKKWGQSRIGGNILGAQKIQLKNVEIDGSIYGSTVVLGKNVMVKGDIYFTDDFQNQEKLELARPPQKISRDQLIKMMNSVGVAIKEASVNTSSNQSLGVTSKPNSNKSGNRPVFCARCGSPLEIQVNFCPSCGLKVDDE